MTGSDGGTSAAAKKAGADAFVRKPFSPLELLAVAERLAGGTVRRPFPSGEEAHTHGPGEELLLYARDLRHMLEVERGQRELLAERVPADRLGARERARVEGHGHARAFPARPELRDRRSRAPSARQRLARDQSTPYGFLLHDVGKIGIPDGILQKPGPLSPAERRKMETHTVLGRGDALGRRVPQGRGPQDRALAPRALGRARLSRTASCGEEIPLGARIFAVADALDAMTSHRPYRRALSWSAAHVARSSSSESGSSIRTWSTPSSRPKPTSRQIRRELAAA